MSDKFEELRRTTDNLVDDIDQQALKNIADISGDMEDITKKLAELTEKNVADIEKIYTQVITDGVNTYKPLFDYKNMTFVPFEQNDFAKAIVTNWYRKTSAEMVNLSRTKAIGFTDGNGNFTPLRGAYQKAIDEAVIYDNTGWIKSQYVVRVKGIKKDM